MFTTHVHVPSSHPASIPCVHIPGVHHRSTPQSTLYVHTLCPHPKSTPQVHASHPLPESTPQVHIPSSHLEFTPYIHTLIPNPLRTLLVHNPCSQPRSTPHIHRPGPNPKFIPRVHTPHLHQVHTPPPHPKFTPCIHTLNPRPLCTFPVHSLGLHFRSTWDRSTPQVYTHCPHPTFTLQVYIPSPYPAVAPCCLLTGSSWSKQTSGQPTSPKGLPLCQQLPSIPVAIVFPCQHLPQGPGDLQGELYPETSVCHTHPKAAWRLSYRSINTPENTTPSPSGRSPALVSTTGSPSTAC